jgi:hypothetical protein
MKKQIIFFIPVSLLLIIIIISCNQNNKLKSNVYDWFKTGSKPDSYEIGTDENVKYNNEPVLSIKSTANVEDGFGTMMKRIRPDKYSGKRIRMTAAIKTEDVDVMAAMWMRVDKNEKTLQFDNMNNRPIKGTTDWTKYEIVLDVSQSSTLINYGVLLSGNGQVWFNRPEFEEVGNDVPTTNIINDSDYNKLPEKLENIPDGIEVINIPDTVRAAKIEGDTNNYYWFHKTSVKALNEDLEITEFGAYHWDYGDWEFGTVTGKPFTKKDFEDWYNCKSGKLIKGKEYTDKKNWSRLPELQNSIVLWYYLAKNEKGEIFKGTAMVVCLTELIKK